MASNVTKLVPRGDSDAPRPILQFMDGYLEGIYHGNRWRDLADRLATWKCNIPASIHPFIAQMQKRKERPTTAQLGTMIGLFVSAMAIDRFNSWEARTDGAEVVALKK